MNRALHTPGSTSSPGTFWQDVQLFMRRRALCRAGAQIQYRIAVDLFRRSVSGALPNLPGELGWGGLPAPLL
jgi:hypothetical protein